MKKQILETQMHRRHGLKSDALSFIQIAKFVLEIIKEEDQVDAPLINNIKLEGAIQVLKTYERHFGDCKQQK